MAEVLIPGTLGILVDVGGLLVILVTSIPQMRDLAIFGAFWVTAILATVELLHPIMICYLPAPHAHEHFLPRSMIAFTRFVGNVTTDPTWKWVIAGVTVVIFSTLGLHHAVPLQDRRGEPGHVAALAEPSVQRRDRRDRASASAASTRSSST